MQKRMSRPARRTEALAFLVVSAVAIRLTFGLLGQVRVKLGDETLYLASGLHPTAAHPIAQSSPLYGAWYRLLSAIQPDPARLYLLNWFVLTASLPILLYVLARRSGAPLWASALASWVWAASGVALVWPSGSKLSTLILAVGALAATRWTGRFARWALAAVTLVVATAVRPELFPAALAVSVGVSLWGLSWGRKQRSTLVGATLVACVALGSGVGLPSPFTDNRTLSAFEQHYALNVSHAQAAEGVAPPIDPWTDSEEATRADFGDVDSVAEAALENPGAFAWHVGHNLRKLPAVLRNVVAPSARFGSVVRVTASAMLGALALAGSWVWLAAARRRARRQSPELHAEGRALTPSWAPLSIAVSVSALAGVIVIHPREHYLVAPLFFALALTASAASHLPKLRLARAAQWRGAAFAPFAVAFAAGALTLLPVGSLAPQRSPSRCALKVGRTAEAMRRSGVREHVVVLESKLGHATYAGLPFRTVYPSQRVEGESMWSFLHSREVGVVVVDKGLRAHSRFSDDLQEDEAVARDAHVHGFDTLWVEGTEVILLVRRGT